MMGIDCDPDRNVYPKLAWTGVDAIEQILGLIPFVLNMRFDRETTQLTKPIVNKAIAHGCSVGIHYHPVNADGTFNSSWTNAYDMFNLIPDDFKSSMHDGWGWQGLLDLEEKVGFKINYSPLPGAVGPNHDWRNWKNKPKWRGNMLTLPVQTIKTRISRSINNIATVHPTAPPILFRRLVRAFEETHNNTFCCYFHADELNGAIGGLRRYVYSRHNLIKNIHYLKSRGYIFQNANDVYSRFVEKT